jgi:serine protease AprX
MNRVLKVFVTGPEQQRLPNVTRVIEQYDGFVVVEASETVAQNLSQAYLVQDITDLYTIQVGEQQIETTRPRINTEGKRLAHPAYTKEKPLLPGWHHYLVQFVGPIKQAWLNGLRRLGAQLREPHGDFSYIVRADDPMLKDIAAQPYVRWLGHLPIRQRIAQDALNFAGRKADDYNSTLPRTRVRPGVYTVEFFSAENAGQAESAIRKLGFTILAKDEDARLLVAQTTESTKAKVIKQLQALARIHGVRMIRERPIKRLSNDVAAGVMKTTAAFQTSGLGLSGKGETIGICDTGLDNGDPATIHPDFAGRISFIKSYPITAEYAKLVTNPGADDGPADLDSGHGTHVCGSALGSGVSSAGLQGLMGPIRGLASEAKVVFQAVEQEMKWKDPRDFVKPGRYILAGIPLDLGDLFQDAYAKGVRIHSDSWGGGDAGAYDDQCAQLDRFVWKRNDFCIVVAAGNDGTDKDGKGEIAQMSVTPPGTAKNCITVGASENLRPNFTVTYGEDWPQDFPVAPFNTEKLADDPDRVVAFSSRGPTVDGRTKPDVVAPGTYILSTRSRLIAGNHFGWGRFAPSNLYMYDGGTSMATPLVAGVVALLREYMRSKKAIASPSAALLKAALIAGATRLPGEAVKGAVMDNAQGFGRVNVDAVVSPAPPATATFAEVAPGLRTGEMHAVDFALKSNKAPLRVVLAYSDYPGDSLVNDLNLVLRGPNGLTLTGNATPGAPGSLDSNNNVEAIHVATPTAGAYTVQVIASNVPQGPQPFALVYVGDI